MLDSVSPPRTVYVVPDSADGDGDAVGFAWSAGEDEGGIVPPPGTPAVGGTPADVAGLAPGLAQAVTARSSTKTLGRRLRDRIGLVGVEAEIGRPERRHGV